MASFVLSYSMISRFLKREDRFMQQYGYIRVSTKEQNPERQFLAIQGRGIPRKYIYLDKMSGRDFQRTEYQKLMRKLKKGDLLVIKSIDRLGRNYGEILEQWRRITREIGADIEVLDMPLLNTAAGHDDLTGVFISDLVLQILAYVAETERAFIRSRQSEGIAAARARGVQFGRHKKEVPEEFQHYYRLWTQGEITVRQAAEKLGMSSSTFYRRCKEEKKIISKGRECETCFFTN